MLPALDEAAVGRWCRTAVEALSAARGDLDELNVFPVPDGDTGTNLLLTAQAALDAVEREGGSATDPVWSVLARGAVLGARGNSGTIFAQLWHVGRVSHSSFQPDGALPVAPSAVAIPAEFKCMTADGKVVEYETPRALETAEVALMVEAYRQGAKNALAAGFDRHFTKPVDAGALLEWLATVAAATR